MLSGTPTPLLRSGLPWLGHALEFYRDPIGLLQRGYDELGEIFEIRLAGRRTTILIGPRANEVFFKAPDDLLSAKEVYQFTVPIFGKGIAYDASSQGLDDQLALVFPALRDQRLQKYAQYMEEEAEQYFSQWTEDGEIDLLKTTSELTMFIASRCLIGREFRLRLNEEFATLYHDLEGGINLLAFLNPSLPLPSHTRRDRARAQMVQLISRIVADRRANEISDEDFLQTLMEARWQDGATLTDDQITGLLLTLIFAGHHTSAVLAAWTGILLLQHPQFLGPVLDEQREVIPHRSAMTLQDIRRMTLLERCIKEAERLRPPLIVLMRAVLRDFEFAGYTIRAGGMAMVSPAVSHRLNDIFVDSDRYDPARFAPGREEDRKSQYRLIGFGGGRHRCIGQSFAYQQVKVIWSVLLRRFELELAQPEYEPNYATFVVGPRQPCVIRYHRKRPKDDVPVPIEKS
jgi:sterol 14alpha-demethylase